MSRRYRRRGSAANYASLVALFLIVFGGLGYMLAYASSQNHVTITVKNKEATREGYRVFTQNEVFEVDDTLLFRRFDSSDDYNNLVEGTTYRVQVVGWRVPFFSMYRNIISYSEVVPQFE